MLGAKRPGPKRPGAKRPGPKSPVTKRPGCETSKSVTLTFRPWVGVGIVLRKFVDKYLSSAHIWIRSIQGFFSALKGTHFCIFIWK